MAATTIIADIRKEIKYDRETRDYNCLISIDGGPFESIGFASTYGQAEIKCNQYAFDYLNDNHAPEQATELLLDPPTWTEQIGTIDGAPVEALFSSKELICASMTWGGLRISTDGIERVNAEVTGACEGDMTLGQWATLRAIAQNGIMDRLISLAQSSRPAFASMLQAA